MGRGRCQPTRGNDGIAENELLDEVVRGEVPGYVRKMQKQFAKEQTLKVQVKPAKTSLFKTMDKNGAFCRAAGFHQRGVTSLVFI